MSSSCVRAGELWRRRLRVIAGNPATVLLALLGTALLLAGVVVDEAALVVMGPGAMVLAVLVSFLKECTVGPTGMTMMFREEDAEAEFRACAEALTPSLLNLARELSTEGRPAGLVKRVLGRCYLEWEGDPYTLKVQALCGVVRGALRPYKSAGRPPPYREAALLLHDEHDFDWGTVARMLHLTVEAVLHHVEQPAVAP